MSLELYSAENEINLTGFRIAWIVLWPHDSPYYIWAETDLDVGKTLSNSASDTQLLLTGLPTRLKDQKCETSETIGNHEEVCKSLNASLVIPDF